MCFLQTAKKSKTNISLNKFSSYTTCFYYARATEACPTPNIQKQAEIYKTYNTAAEQRTTGRLTRTDGGRRGGGGMQIT